MVSMPARCTQCGFAFQPRGGIDISNSTNITMRGNTTSCPRCGGIAEFLEGRFDVVDEAIKMASGPRSSWLLVEELRLGLQRIVEENPDDPVAEVEAIAPDVGKALRVATRGWTKTDILTLIGVLLAVLTWGDVTPSDVGQWVSDARDQLLDVIAEAEKTGRPPPVPPGSEGSGQP